MLQLVDHVNVFLFYHARVCTLYHKMKKKHFIFMHCWMKLKEQSNWLVFVTNSLKTGTANENEGGDQPFQKMAGFLQPRMLLGTGGVSVRWSGRSKKGRRPR